MARLNLPRDREGDYCVRASARVGVDGRERVRVRVRSYARAPRDRHSCRPSGS